MKLKHSLIATAALAVGAAGTAFADPIPVEGLFFSARDSVNNTSIVINLGMTTTQFLASPPSSYTLSGASLSTLQGWLSTAAPNGVEWTVLGILDDGSGGNIPPTHNYGGLSISSDITTIYADWGNFGGLDTTVSGNTTWRNIVNQQLGSTNAYTTVGNTNAYHFASQDGGVGFNSRTTLGQTVGFYQFFASETNNYFEGGYAAVGGSWTLSFANSVASLVYASATAPVPVPAAIWLLGSGLLGLAGIARRK